MATTEDRQPTDWIPGMLRVLGCDFPTRTGVGALRRHRCGAFVRLHAIGAKRARAQTQRFFEILAGKLFWPWSAKERKNILAFLASARNIFKRPYGRCRRPNIEARIKARV